MTGTFSRTASSFVEGVYPVYANSANGAYFKDVDDNDYLDLVCSFGPISLGHNYPVVNDAITKSIGWMQVAVNQDADHGMGEVELLQPEPFDIFVDPKARDILLLNCFYKSK